MNTLWVIGGIVAWITVAVLIGRVWRRINPWEDRDILTIFSITWPIMLPIVVVFSPIILGAWAINRPTKAERLKEKQETDRFEASKLHQTIVNLERELDL